MNIEKNYQKLLKDLRHKGSQSSHTCRNKRLWKKIKINTKLKEQQQ